ncbi:MAG TPA: beta-ketoacyl-ACP synthase II [Xanthomonadales bacterium]|nr:beta-ketoacyl-ACP synthase II [Xanthomonadales bacterium]
MSKRRIVITGLGLLSPVGNTVEAAWTAIREGKSGIGPVTEFDVSPLNTRIAGEIRDFDPGQYMDEKEARRSDKFLQYGVAAGVQAIADAGLLADDPRINPDRIGFALGAGIGGIATIESTMLTYRDKGPRRVSPFYIPGSIVNMIGGSLSIRFGFKGPNIAIVTACTTSTHNIGMAARMISYGDADVMIAGGAEYGTTPTAMAGFAAAKAMSTRNDDPQAASRPWDRERDGFVLSNGAGVLVVEELEHAKQRGAKIYAELIGFGMSGDAYHMTAPPDDGEGAARCMAIALKDAGVNPTQVDYINAHGTSTPLGDRAESDAVKSTFGAHAYSMMVSSTKSMTGHLLGAAGGVEAIFTILAMRDGVVPPTINLDNPGEGCDLDYVPNTARDAGINIALSNSFGFGGTNGTLIFSRLSG